MKVSIVEKNELKFYGIVNQATEASDFSVFWESYYKYVSADYNAPIGFATAPDGQGMFSYYTCIQHIHKNPDIFKEVILPKGNYAIFELTGSVKKIVPKAWKFAKKKFVIKDSPSIEIYSSGDRLNKKYRMDLWIPITDVLPIFKKNTSFIGKLKRDISDSIENIIEYSKTDEGKFVLSVGGVVLAAGATLLLTGLANSDCSHEDDEDFDYENYSVSDVTDYQDSPLGGSHNYPDERKSPVAHPYHRNGVVVGARGGTAEDRAAIRKEYGLD